MDTERIISNIEMYAWKLQTRGIPKQRMDPKRTFASLSPEEALAHAHFLCDDAKEFARDPERYGKANRHLSAIQICLSLGNWYTLEELMGHNKP